MLWLITSHIFNTVNQGKQTFYDNIHSNMDLTSILRQPLPKNTSRSHEPQKAESWLNFDYLRNGSVKKQNGQIEIRSGEAGGQFPSANYTTTTTCWVQDFSELLRMETNYRNYFIHLFLSFLKFAYTSKRRQRIPVTVKIIFELHFVEDIYPSK